MYKILQKSREKHFRNFVQETENIFKNYVLLDELSYKKYKNLIEDNLFIWNLIYKNAIDRVLLGLHEIFNNDNDSVNIYLLGKNIDDKNLKTKLEKIIDRKDALKKKIENWRDKIIAHKDKKTIDKTIQELGIGYQITIGSLKDLLEDLYKIIDLLKDYFNYKTDYLNKKKEIEENIRLNIQNLLKN